MNKWNLLLIIGINLISSIFSTFCGINPPENEKYCGNYLGLNSTHRCCYCSLKEDPSVHYCLIVVNEQPIDGYDCGCDNITVDIDLPGAPCLNHSITKELDELNSTYCHSLSIDEKHPCCFYDDGFEQKCFSIGKITSKTMYTYNEYLDCYSKFETINYFLIIMILLITF